MFFCSGFAWRARVPASRAPFGRFLFCPRPSPWFCSSLAVNASCRSSVRLNIGRLAALAWHLKRRSSRAGSCLRSSLTALSTHYAVVLLALLCGAMRSNELDKRSERAENGLVLFVTTLSLRAPIWAVFLVRGHPTCTLCVD